MTANNSVLRFTLSYQSGLLAAVLFCLILLVMLSAQAIEMDDQQPLPAFTQTSQSEWFNSAPLATPDLKGKVILLDFWTFDCWNCYRSFPWLHALEARYRDKGLMLIGIHTPEYSHEKVRANVAAKVLEFGITYPVMMDNDSAYWRAMNNRYWPTFYLIDKSGQVRARFIGETHAETRQAKTIESQIKLLLSE